MKLNVKTLSLEEMSKFYIEKLVKNVLFYIQQENSFESEIFISALKIILNSLQFCDMLFISNLRSEQVPEYFNAIINNSLDTKESPNQVKNLSTEILKLLVQDSKDSSHSNPKIVSNFIQISHKIGDKNFNKSDSHEKAFSLNPNPTNILDNKGNFFDNNFSSNIPPPELDNILSFTSNFPSVTICKEDEQKIFDININLKYGNSLQISNNLNYFYSLILNDFPVEYLLQNSELLKTVLILLEKSNFYEFGVILFKTLNKILHLIEKKIRFYNTSYTHNNSMQGKSSKNNLKYKSNEPNPHKNNIPHNSHNNNHCESLSILDFLILSMEAIFLSMERFDNFIWAMNLIELSYNLMKKVIFDDSTDQWIATLSHLLRKCQLIISHFKNENYEADLLREFCLKFLLNMTENSLRKFLKYTSCEIYMLLREIIFGFFNKNNKILKQFLEKIRSISTKSDLDEKNNFEDWENLNRLLKDYENSEIVKKCLAIVTHYTNFNSHNDQNYFFENFDNILIALKYTLEAPTCGINFNLINATEFVNLFCLGLKVVDNNIINQCLSKLLSLIIHLDMKSDTKDFKFNFYTAFYNSLKLGFLDLFSLFPDLIFYFYDELSDETNTSEIKDILYNIICDSTKHLTRAVNKINSKILRVLSAFHVFKYDLKNISLDRDISLLLQREKNLSPLFKYLKLLFHMDDKLRLNAVNYFSLLSYEQSLNKLKQLEFLDLKGNFERLKHKDTLLYIRSAEKEFPLIIETILRNESQHLEFYPLLNILFSTVIEKHLKISAIEQIILFLNKKEYSQLFSTEVFTYLLTELEEFFKMECFRYFNNEPENMKHFTSEKINYMTSLLKLVNLIIFFKSNESENNIKPFYNSNSFNFESILHNLIKIIFCENLKNKHLLCVQALIFIFLFSFSNENFNETILNQNEKNTIFMNLPKIYSNIYHINICPYIKYFFLSKDESNFIKNYSFDKFTVEYLTTSRLKKLDNEEEIAARINLYIDDYINYNSHNDPNYLEVYLTFLKFFSQNDLLNENFEVSLLTLFKKILPVKNEDKNLICDFLNILSLYLKRKTLETITSINIHVKNLINDILISNISFLSNNKNLLDSLENISLVNSILEFLNDNKSIIKIETLDQKSLKKFTSNLSNTSILILDEDIYSLNLNLVQVFNSFSTILFKLEDKINNINDTNTSNDRNEYEYTEEIINYLDYHLSKYNILNESLTNRSFIKNCLSLLNRFSELSEAFKRYIVKKSFALIKFLQSNTMDFVLLTIEILKHLISLDLFKKHPMLLTVVYDLIISNQNETILKISLVNFMNLSLEFLFKNKNLDEEHHLDFLTEIITLNNKIFDISQLLIIKNLISKNLHISSLYSSSLIKLLMNILNIISISDQEIFVNFFSVSAFYDLADELISKEVRELSDLNHTNIFSIFSIFSMSSPALVYKDPGFQTKQRNLRLIDSISNVNECLLAIIKSFIKNDPKILLDKFKDHICKIAFSLLSFARKTHQNMAGDQEIILFIVSNKLKIIEEFISKFFSFYNLLYNFDSKFINFFLSSVGNADQEFFDLNYDLLKLSLSLETAESIDSKIIFAKNLPFFLETISFFNNNEKQMRLSLKNPGDTLLELMTALSVIYKIKIDNYHNKYRFIFEISNDNISLKNVIINAISSILLESKQCKIIFIKSHFIHTFIDYLKQLTDVLYDWNLDKSKKKAKFSTSLSDIDRDTYNFKNLSNTCNINYVNNVCNKLGNLELEYILNEFKRVLILLQNFSYQFEDCVEKRDLFNGNKNETSEEKTYKNRTSLLKLLYDIFYETFRYPDLFESYLKLVINLISKSEMFKSSFILHINDDKETFLNLILDYFNKSFSTLNNSNNFELFVDMLLSLFQNKNIILYLIKKKFLENFVKEVENIFNNKKSIQNNYKFIELILKIIVSLSFDSEVSKKIATKSFVDALGNLLLKTKNENIIYNSLFILRNFSFIPNNKIHFLANENILGMILAILSGESSIKIKFIISHLLWVLLYNNQTLKSILNKEEFKSELNGILLHLQKESDTRKFLHDGLDPCIDETLLNFRKVSHILES